MGKRTLLRLLLCTLTALALGGCLLISGEETTVDLRADGGNQLTTFVGAEGRAIRHLDVGTPGAEVQVIVIVSLESGDLEVAVAEAGGAISFAVAGRPDSQITRSGTVLANEQGQITYTVTARGARHGSYQIFVQP
jgi:hypothetical protein